LSTKAAAEHGKAGVLERLVAVSAEQPPIRRVKMAGNTK